MKVSELMHELVAVMAEDGDIEVFLLGFDEDEEVVYDEIGGFSVEPDGMIILPATDDEETSD